MVNAAMEAAIAGLPAGFLRSVIWDQGKELARHREFSVSTGIAVYFCDPHSPWQQSLAERIERDTNGLLRQYMPKGTDLSVHSQDDLQLIAQSLNNRPRETLGFMKPNREAR